MGRRGPTKGATNAGRPPGPAKKLPSKLPSKRKKPAASDLPLTASWAATLGEMPCEQLVELAGQWRPLLAQDRLLVVLLQDTARRYAQLAEYVGNLDVDAWCQTAESGYQSLIPQIGLLSKSFEQLCKLATRFGLSPGDRARMGEQAAEDEADDVLAEQWKHGNEITTARKKSVKNAATKKRSRATPLRSRAIPKRRPVGKAPGGKARKAGDRTPAKRPQKRTPKAA